MALFNEEKHCRADGARYAQRSVFQRAAVAEESSRYADKLKGWRFVPVESLEREYSDVFIESMVREALIRQNPEIKAQPDRVDEVLYRLRAIPLSVQSEGLVRANEMFAEWLRGEKSMPFGEKGEHTQVKLIDFEELDNNDYVADQSVGLSC